MGESRRSIGLSLGADLCWPLCYEELLRRLELTQPYQGETVHLDVERLTIEPFSLRQPCKYDLVFDRVTHWYGTSREWIKKAVLMDGLYVLNNPWSIQSMEKQTTYCAMMRLGLPVPETWMVPPKEYDPLPDLDVTLQRYARLFDLGQVGRDLGYPMFMKPYDGGAWVSVSRIDSENQLRAAYEQSGKRVMHLQKAIQDWDLFVRCIGVGPQTRKVRYDPDAPLHARYTTDRDFLRPEESSLIEDMTLTINSFFGWDFNSCETLRSAGVFYPIDFANACPDSQVTSLHYHFPWLVKAVIKWTVFCAVTRRKMRKSVDWDPYYEIADRELSYREKLAGYAAIARRQLDTDGFQEFCDTYMPHFDELVWEFFGSALAKEAVRLKVQAIFPQHEVDQFTDHFWTLIQQWRDAEGHKDA